MGFVGRTINKMAAAMATNSAFSLVDATIKTFETVLLQIT